MGLAPSGFGLKRFLFRLSTPAVCIPPGARLRLYDIPAHLQQRVGVGEVEDVSFVQQNMEAFRYRDAVRFANGNDLLLQFLRLGQRVDVLSLSPAPAAEEQTNHRMREEAYRQLFVG